MSKRTKNTQVTIKLNGPAAYATGGLVAFTIVGSAGRTAVSTCKFVGKMATKIKNKRAEKKLAKSQKSEMDV